MEFKQAKFESEIKEKRELFESFEFLQTISNIESLSGQEEIVRQAIVAELGKMKIEGKIDKAGNLWVDSICLEKDILLCAHLDKAGPSKQAEVDGENIIGRLDDAFGVGLILNALKKGFRPSVLFTVNEEHGFHGSQYASKQILELSRKPKIILVIDVSGLKNRGDGPIIYTSSGHVNFPEEGISVLQGIFEKDGIKANFIPGVPNDSMVLASKIPRQNIATLQAHVDYIHSQREVAAIQDIKDSEKALEEILKHFQD